MVLDGAILAAFQAIGEGVIATTTYEEMKKHLRKIFKKEENRSRYIAVLRRATEETAKKLESQDQQQFSSVVGKLKEIISDPEKLLSSPVIYKDEFMKRFAESNIPMVLQQGLFNDIETSFFKMLYNDGISNDEEFRRAVISQLNQMLSRQNILDAKDDQILNAVTTILNDEKNWTKMFERLDELEQTARENLELSQKIYDFLTLQEASVSYALIEVDEKLDDEALRKIAHVKQSENSREAPFVHFGNESELAALIESEKSLFFRGVSGSGKSRAIYETLKKREQRAKKIWVVGAEKTLSLNLKGIDCTIKISRVADLVDQIKKTSIVGTQLMVWDNFPDGLLGKDLPYAALTEFSRLQAEGLEILIALNPEKYGTKEDPEGGPIDFEKVDVNYNKDQFRKMLEVYGKIYLNVGDYDRRVKPFLEELSKKLFKNWNLPIAVELFYSKAMISDYQDFFSLASEISDQDKADVFRSMVKKLDKPCKDFLWTLKMAQLFGEDNSPKNIAKLQKRIFGEVLKEPRAKLGSFFYGEGGSFQMHDFYKKELRFDGDGLDSIFAFLKAVGFETFIESRRDRLDQWGFINLGQFFAKNTEYFNLGELIIALTRKLKIYKKRSEAFLGIIVGIGEAFNFLDCNEKALVWEQAQRNYSFAKQLGSGLDKTFGSLSDEYKSKVLEFARKKKGFAECLGFGIGEAFGSLSDEYKSKVIELARENYGFACGCADGMSRVFDSLTNEDKLRFMELLREIYEFRGLWIGVDPRTFLMSLSDESKLKLLELVHGKEFFSELVGRDIGRYLDYKSKDYKLKVEEFAKVDPSFSKGLQRGLEERRLFNESMSKIVIVYGTEKRAPPRQHKHRRQD